MFAIFALGEVRRTALSEYDSTSFFQELSSVNRNAVELPGNGAGIYLTFLGTLHIYTYNSDWIYGDSYLKELQGILPDKLTSLAGLRPYRGIGYEVYNNYFPYKGGMHALSTSYANFGLIGVIVLGFLVGRIFAFVDRELAGVEGSPYAVLVVALAPAALWYNFNIWISWTFYMSVLLIILRIVPFKR